MYIRIDDLGEELYKKVKEITFTNYAIDEDRTLISIENLIGMIEDLVYSYEHKQEELEDLENDIEDNYRPIPQAEQYCINDDDFI